MSRLLGKGFKYTPSFDTDVRKSFEAERKRLKAAFEAEKQRSEEIIKEAESIVAKTRIKAKVANG